MKRVLPGIAVSLLLCVAMTASAQEFLSAKDYPVGKSPVAVVVGDFNRDAKLDLAVANSGSSDLSILLGNGDGTFRPAVSHALDNPPTFVCVGDFNGDQNPDLVFGDMFKTTVTVLLGNGDGNFQPPVQYDVGITAEYIVAADFNDDKKLDLLVYNGQGVLSVLLGNGDGTFQPRLITSLPANSSNVAVADFNNDGNLDVVSADSSGPQHEGYTGQLVVLLGNGDGTFRAPLTQPANFLTRFLLAGDFNGDGKIDLAVATKQSVFGGKILIFLGDGQGGFAPRAIEYGFDESLLGTADVNRDGKPDIIGLEAGDPESLPMGLLTFFGNGDGSFVDATFNPCEPSGGCTPISAVPGWLSTGDFNGDRFPDVVVANPFANSVSVFLNTSTGRDFVLSATELAPSELSPGQLSTAAIEVYAEGGFDGTVSLSCSVNPQPASAPECALSPTSIVPGTPATLTVSTAASAAAMAMRQDKRFSPSGKLWLAVIGLAIAGMALKRKRDPRPQSMSMLAGCGLMLLILTGQVGCGGGNSAGQGNVGQNSVGQGNVGQSSVGAPAGTYTITVNATSGSITHSTSQIINVR